MIIALKDVAFSYGGNLIFSGADFEINAGERVALIGANGEGKTTLLKLITGELYPDGGEVLKKSGAKIGYLEQNGGYSADNTVYGEMLTVFSEELAAVEKLNVLSAKLSACVYGSAEYETLSAQIEGVRAYIASHDCYNAEVKIKTVLNGMGFKERYEQYASTMSGGEKTRLKLCRLLLEEPELLILDEPTNHLDITTLFWLEDYLSSFKGALLIVSHDRYFLDRLCTRTLELENRKLLSFAGNYTKYKVLKRELVTRQLKEYEAQQEERAKLSDYVARNIVRATTAKSAQSRVKQLEKMEILEKPYIPRRPPEFRFTYEFTPYENVLEIKDFTLSVGGKTLADGGSLLVRRGDKVALVGENGTGKSTLLKQIMTGENRSVSVGRYVKFAYYDQEGGNLNGGNAVMAELWERHVGFTQTEIRSALARAGLYEEDMDKSVNSLSGGERAKLALCILESEHGNVLVLDEPTNHLDLPARESLERALKEFDGTLLFVSHDRYFLSALAGRVAEIDDSRLNVYEGGYAFYAEEKRKLRESLKRQEESERSEKADEQRKASYRSKKERAEEARRKALVSETERAIERLENREAEINRELSEPSVAADYKKVLELLSEIESIKIELDGLYKRYEDMI